MKCFDRRSNSGMCAARRFKTSKGFTLVELLVVVVIIGILAAIALPNFMGAQLKAKNAAVKGNMRAVQIASESYATDAGGDYGQSLEAIQPFAPGGSNKISGSPGTWPPNPIATTTVGAMDYSSSVADANAVAALRTAALSTGNTPGMAAYKGTQDKKSYVISGYGCDSAGTQLADSSGAHPLIFSNQ